MNAAAKAYINSNPEGVKVDSKKKVVKLSEIFKWYADDFGGEGKLTGAAGQLKYRIKDTADGTFALVSGDTDGDGSADIKIRVFGETTLTAGDFIL